MSEACDFAVKRQNAAQADGSRKYLVGLLWLGFFMRTRIFRLPIPVGGVFPMGVIDRNGSDLGHLGNANFSSIPIVDSVNINHAKCIADVTASVYYQEIQGCLADRECSAVESPRGDSDS